MRKIAPDQRVEDPLLMRLIRAIVNDDERMVTTLIGRSPSLARRHFEVGATRQRETDFFFEEIKHYLYAGDTALHAAAAGYRLGIARQLIKSGSDVRAANRRGAEPLHYAADGIPGSRHWNPGAQADIIALLIDAGADPNALDKSGVAPLHRAVRQRCLGAVDSLLRNRSSVRLRNKSGSTALHLAVQSVQVPDLERTLRLLVGAGADRSVKNNRGETAQKCLLNRPTDDVRRGNVTYVSGYAYTDEYRYLGDH